MYITVGAAGPGHAVFAPPPSCDDKQIHTTRIMKAFVCVVLLAAVALAAPEGKRDKRGFLHGGYSGYSGLSLDHSFGHDFGHGYDDIHIGHGAILDHAPARIVSINKVVEVPKVVEVKKIVSVPHVVQVSRLVAAPRVRVSYSHAPLSAGWW